MTTTDSCVFGVNLPWLDGAYGHDLAPNELRPSWSCDFNALRAYRPLIEASALGFEAVRVWLCENAEGIVTTKEGRPDHAHADLLENITVLQECAHLLGIRIYWTLLDGNSWRRETDTLTHSILSNADACARFAERVAAPVVSLLDPAVTFAVEVVNEPEALSPSCVKPSAEGVPWEVLARSIRHIGDAIRGARPGATVTAGTHFHYLPELLKLDPRLDAIDVHAYLLNGGLPSRQDLSKYSGDPRFIERSMPLFVGECGIPDDAPAEARPAVTNFIYNAKKLEYDAMFLWQLEGVMIDATTPRREVTKIGNHLKAILDQVRA